MTATQRPPEPGIDLSNFPETTVAAGESMYRSHSVAHGAWYFDNGDGGRFNLHGGRGTCCTATTVDTAVREKVRDHASFSGVVSAAFAATFRVSVVSAPVPHRCAAVHHVDAAKNGIVREIGTMLDYSVPQAWADAFDVAGFGGVFYGTAYTTGDATAYALFGNAGAPAAGSGWTETEHLTGADACVAAGLTVSSPTSRGIAVIS